MTKSKKHSPQQTEDRTETILGQVPDDKMGEFIKALSKLKPVSSPSNPSSQESSPSRREVPNPPSLFKKQ